MFNSRFSGARRALCAFGLLAATLFLSGCAVIAVVDTAAGLAVSGAGLAADAAIGTVRMTGKVIGAAADVVMPSSK